MSPRFPPKYPVVGTPISVTTITEVQNLLGQPRTDRATVIAVCNVHSVMAARRDSRLAQALNEAEVATPDGMPLVWGLRAMADKKQQRVYGPELMRRAVSDPQSTHRHFLFGSTPETLERLEVAMRLINPAIRIAGAISPPFLSTVPTDQTDVLEKIRKSDADVIWVGLGMPKQELWMHSVRDQLPGKTLVGVGAAFDFISGTKKQAPEWMGNSGLEWIYRLINEPRRLWRRYLWNNPSYLVLLALQLIRNRFRVGD